MAGSAGRGGAAGDNAAVESFLSLLQKNVLDRRVRATRGELRIAIVTWIEQTSTGAADRPRVLLEPSCKSAAPAASWTTPTTG